MRDENAFLFDMLDSAQLIQRYIRGFTRQQFDKDVQTQDAVIHRIAIIGEAAKQISQATRAKLPALPFHQMAGMRDKIIHAYWGIELDVVWDSATNGMALLVEAITPLLPPAPGPQQPDAGTSP